MHNIEKSGFHKGQYVGYGGGTVFRVRPVTGGWLAVDQHNKQPSFQRKTLKEISAYLNGLPTVKTNPAKRKTKRTRTPAQKAATARMLAANKAKRAGTKWKAGKRTPAQRSARKRANTVAGYYPNPGARRSYAVRALRPGEYFVVRLDQRDGREYGIDAVTPLSWSVAIVAKPPADISFKIPPTLYKNPGFLAWAEKYSARHSLFASLNEIKRQVQAMM